MRPDNAGEPSMEEILASIRRTIAEEQQAKMAPSARTDAPLRSGNGLADRVPPSLDRLPGTDKSGAAQGSSFFGSKRPSSFDDDLADLLDEPSSPNEVAAPKPSFDRTLDIPGFMRPRTAEERPPAAAPPAPSLDLPETPGVSGPPPAQTAAGEAPIAPPIPMRKTGFYPPPGYTPKLPGFLTSPQTEEPAPARAPDGVLKRLTELGAVVPKDSLGIPGSAPRPEAFETHSQSLGAPADDRLDSGAVSHSDSTPAPARVSDKTPAPLSEASEPLVPGQAESFVGEPEPAAEESGDDDAGKPVEQPAGISAAPELVAVPAAPEPSPVEAQRSEPHIDTFEPAESPADAPSTPAGLEISELSAANPAPLEAVADVAGPAQVPEQPQLAAKMALDALAQGLAVSASSRSFPPLPGEPAQSTAAKDHFLSEQSRPRAEHDEPPPAASSRPHDQRVRTLEDVVADMLKPMLQQWLAENMPRIVEKALRVEAASVVNRNAPPPPQG